MLGYVFLGGVLGLLFMIILVAILGDGLEAMDRNKKCVERLEEYIKGSEVVDPEEIINLLRGEGNVRN